MSRLDTFGPLPREVAAYAQARARGLLPETPDEPPALLPGRSARERAMRFAVLAVAGLIAGFVLVSAGPGLLGRVGLGEQGGVIATGLLSLALLCGLWCEWGRVGHAAVAEMHRGYTTFELGFGGFWVGRARRWPAFHHRAPWDYSGLWLLEPHSGRVLRRPDPAVDPPGLYPSPNMSGRMELWTGRAWSGDHPRHPGQLSSW